jgi:hypothetical protein
MRRVRLHETCLSDDGTGAEPTQGDPSLLGNLDKAQLPLAIAMRDGGTRTNGETHVVANSGKRLWKTARDGFRQNFV